MQSSVDNHHTRILLLLFFPFTNNPNPINFCLFLVVLSGPSQLVLLGGVFFFGHWCLNKLERSFSYAVRRFVSLILTTSVCVLVVYLFLSHTLYFKFAVAIYYFLSAVCFCCLLAGLGPVSYLYKMHDYVVGHFIFLLIGILSMFQVGIVYPSSSYITIEIHSLLLIFEDYRRILTHQSII